jgi:S1-C subfamily serine protease
MVWTGNGFGSGFFITPELVLTNRHVVEKSSGTIRVGNHKLGQMMPVQPVAMSSNSNLGEPDYALLKLQSGQSSTFLSMTEELPGQLQNVIAAGYPNNVVSTDANYERLQRGDAAAIPDVALTEGAVVVVQNSETRSPIILHRASISPGSSGGPLIDECGRAIGINTFVRSAKEEEGSDRMHYSLGATSAIQFVKQNGATPNVVSGRCIVSTASNSQKPGADDGGAREQPRQPPPAGAADPKP